MIDIIGEYDMSSSKARVIDLPKSDEVIERHQFYASITSLVNYNSSDLIGISEKIGKFIESFDKLRDGVNATTIRNKTIIGTVILAWSVVGGGVGVYIQKTVATAEQVIVRIDTLERKAVAFEALADSRKDLPEKIAALSRKNGELERRIEELEATNRKK